MLGARICVRGQKEEQNKSKAKERCGKSVAALHGEMWSSCIGFLRKSTWKKAEAIEPKESD